MEHQTPTKSWFMLSIAHGNLIQCGGLLSGFGLLAWTRHMAAPRSTRLLFTSWFITYFCNHAIAHWVVGHLGGIHVAGYGVHGTTRKLTRLDTVGAIQGRYYDRGPCLS